MAKSIFLFSGQGSQYVGMGKVLCQNYKLASDIFDEASEYLGEDMKKLCFQSSREELQLTKNAQPAILTTSYAMFKVCSEEMSLKPEVMAGHSLGEISALTCAGAIDFKDAVQLARKRGEFMQDAVKPGDGLMAAIQTRDVLKVEEICNAVSTEQEPVSISNYNSRLQTVISGSKNAVTKAVELLETENMKTKFLDVSAPFHCILMKPSAERFREELEKCTFHDFKYPVLSNVTADLYGGKEDIITNLTEQIVKPVRWTECMNYAKRHMIQYGVEFGPMKVLKNLMVRNVPDIKIYAYDNAGDVEELKECIKKYNIPFIPRAMGIAVATKNNNFDSDEYRKGVIEPYNKMQRIQQMIEQEQRDANKEEMDMAIDMLLSTFKTKKTEKEEQVERFKQLFKDTGTEDVFQEFDYSLITK